MKKLFLILILAFGVLASFVEAKFVQETSFEVVKKIMSSPTKNIVSEDTKTIIAYKYFKADTEIGFPENYKSYIGKVVKRGWEQDEIGRTYLYVIAYFPGFKKNNYVKFAQYPNREDTIIMGEGELVGDGEEKVFFVGKTDSGQTASWIMNKRKKGGYEVGFFYAAL